MHVANPITDEHNAQKEGVVAQSDVDLSNFEWCIRRCQKIKKNKKKIFTPDTSLSSKLSFL